MLSFLFVRPDRGQGGLDWRVRVYRRLSVGDRPPAWRALFAVVVAGSLVLGAWRWWFRQPVFDDAYISLRYAQNWVDGYGLTFNSGVRVEGYTNFLWVVLAAVGIRLRLDPVSFVRLIGVASYLASVTAVGVFLVREMRDATLGRPRFWRGIPLAIVPWLLAPFILALVFPRGLAAMAGNGLETSFFAMLLTGAGLCAFVPSRASSATWAASVLVAMACLTRPEGVLAIGALAGGVVVRAVGGEGFPRRVGRDLLRAMAIPIAVTAAHQVFRWVYYGQWVPNTYYAKGADGFRIDGGMAYLLAFFKSNPQAGPLLVLLSAALVGTTRARRPLAAYCALVVVAFSAYVLKVGGDFMQFRFAWHVYPTLVLGAALGVATLARNQRSLALAATALTVALSSRKPVMEREYHMQSIAEMEEVQRRGERIGRALSAALPPDTVVSTTMIGAIGYHSRLRVIDQWGLTEPYVRDQPTPERLVRSHQKAAPMEYLVERGVNLFFHHPYVARCEEPPGGSLHILIRLSEGECVRARYLRPTAELTDHMCRHPEHFLIGEDWCHGSSETNPDRSDPPASPPDPPQLAGQPAPMERATAVKVGSGGELELDAVEKAVDQMIAGVQTVDEEEIRPRPGLAL